MRVTQAGEVVFFDVTNGEVLLERSLPIDSTNSITSLQVVNESNGILAVGLVSGEILFFQHQYELEFTETNRIIHPELLFPYGEEFFKVTDGPILDFGIGENEESLSILLHSDNGEIIFQSFIKESSFLDETVALEFGEKSEIFIVEPVIGLLVDPEQEWAYLLTEDGSLSVFDIRNEYLQLQEKVQVTERDVHPSAISYLTGGISILIGDTAGNLSQWFQVRSEGDLPFRLTKIRETAIDNSPVVNIIAEQLRKGIITASQAGKIKMLYTTSERDLLSVPASESAIQTLAVAPRADIFIAEARDNNIKAWHIDNHHPESSMSSLWGQSMV